MRRHRRPVVEASIPDEPAAGVIEVACSGPRFATSLLAASPRQSCTRKSKAERVVLRRYDLSPLLAAVRFHRSIPTDGIASVKLVLLRVHQIERPEGAAHDAGVSTRACQRHASGTTPSDEL